jgi:sterol 3beta-glucosyltransferase
MNISIATIGSRGDVQPYVALGRGLQARGHCVQVVTDGLFESFIREAGLGFAAIDADPLKVLRADNVTQVGQNPLRLVQWIERNSRPLVGRYTRDLKQACANADLLLFSSLALPAPHVAEALGIPALPAYLQPVSPTRAFPSPLIGQLPRWLPGRGRLNWCSFRLVNQLFFWMLKDTLNACRRDILGLRPLPWRTYAALDASRLPVVYGYSPALLPRPADWGGWLHVTGFWFLDEPDGWQPPADLAHFLGSGPPPVYVGFGSMVEREAERLARLVVAALQQAGQRGILLAGWSGLRAANLPDTVLPLDSVPHAWLFPRMRAVVHHGGAGTTAAGLRAGVPSVVVPFFADQAFWAWRVHQAGAGPRPIPRRQLTAGRLAQAIEAALAGEVVRAADDLGRRIRAEAGVAAAATVIEQHGQRAAPRASRPR